MVSRLVEDTDFQIGTTSTALVPLRFMGVPIPTQVVGDKASVYYTRADQSRVGDGATYVQWIWDVLSRHNLYKMLSFLSGADYADVYIRTVLNRGDKPQPRTSFKNYSAIMLRPVQGNEMTPVAGSFKSNSSIRIAFRDLVEV